MKGHGFEVSVGIVTLAPAGAGASSTLSSAERGAPCSALAGTATTCATAAAASCVTGTTAGACVSCGIAGAGSCRAGAGAAFAGGVALGSAKGTSPVVAGAAVPSEGTGAWF